MVIPVYLAIALWFFLFFFFFFLSFVIMHGPGDPRVGKSRRFGLFTPRGCPPPHRRFQQFSKRPQARSCFPRRVPVWRTRFFDGWRLSGVAQLILTVWHTKDRNGRPLLVGCRHRGKHLESISRTSNNRNSSKNHVTHNGNRSETHLRLWATRLANRQKLLENN